MRCAIPSLFPIQRCGAAAVTLALAASGAVPAHAQQPAWRAQLAADMVVKSAGEYRLDQTQGMINFESFSPLCLEPSSTATFRIANKRARATVNPTGKHMVFQDTKAALRRTTGRPDYVRAEGAISAFAWIDGKFDNVRVTGEINTSGGPKGNGAYSRQGLMARWDQSNNFYWLYVNYAKGTVAIMRSRFFGVMEDLQNSEQKIEGFRNTKSYYLEFDLRGNEMQGRVYELRGSNRTLVKETRAVDPDPFASGISGALAEIAQERIDVPLEASFANLTSGPLP
jgi:hypothetical protein